MIVLLKTNFNACRHITEKEFHRFKRRDICLSDECEVLADMKRWNQANLEIEDRQFHLDRHLWPEKTSCYKTIRKVPQTGLDILNKSTQAAPIEEEVRLVESGGCQALGENIFYIN